LFAFKWVYVIGIIIVNLIYFKYKSATKAKIFRLILYWKLGLEYVEFVMIKIELERLFLV